MMTAKAYNGRVILEWLHDALRRAQAHASDPRMPLALLCMTPSGTQKSFVNAMPESLFDPIQYQNLKSYRVFRCEYIAHNA